MSRAARLLPPLAALALAPRGQRARRPVPAARRGPRRLVLGAVVLAGLWLGLAASAAGAPGQLGYDGCLSNDGAQNCGDLFPPGAAGPLDGARDVAVSPDSRSVYVASALSDAVAHFFRAAPEGQIALDGCLSNAGTPNCVDLPPAGLGGPLAGASAVAESPDGESLYVASAAGSIARFASGPSVGPDGQLAYLSCLANDAAAGCGDLPPAGATGPLLNARDVAVSGDGASIYVVAVGVGAFGSLSHFFRGGPAGEIAFGGCLSTSGAALGCVPVGPLEFAAGVAVSPDGRSVYVASGISDAIARFDRIPTGQLGYAGCLANSGAQGCADLFPPGPAGPLDGAVSAAVSPDGRSVYVASFDSGSVAHFLRAPDGALAYDGCLSSSGTPDCGDLPPAGAAGPLNGAGGVAVSADGRSVYVVSGASDSVSHFARALPGGRIAYDGCLANGAAGGCGDLPPAGAGGPLDDAASVAVSPDGRSVYVASFASRSVSHFFRALGADPPPGSVRTPGLGPRAGGVSTPGRVRCRGARATILAAGALTRGTRGRDVIVGRPGRDVIRGLGGNDTICGRGGGDALIGGAGADRLFGEGGPDRLFGGTGRDLLAGGPGRDRLLGGPAIDLLRGGPGRDLLSGGPGRDRLAGGPGLDRQLP